MKKKWIILISISLIIVAGAIWFNTSTEPPIVVKGDLSSKDIAEIRRVVRREVRRQAFPGFSWNSVKELPKNLEYCLRFKIRTVEFHTNDNNQMDNYAYVNYPYGKGGGSEEMFFRVIKGAYGWSVSYSARSSKTTTTIIVHSSSQP